MHAVLIAVNIIAGLFLIGVVLLQSGKGADMGAAFGGANATMFGPSSAGDALTKATAGFAALFMLSSLALAVSTAKRGSVFDGTETPITLAPLPTDDTAAATPPSGAFDPEAAAEAAAAAAATKVDDAVGDAAEKVEQAAVAAVDATGGAAGAATEKAAEVAGSAAAVAGEAAGAAGNAADSAEKAADAVDPTGGEQ